MKQETYNFLTNTPISFQAIAEIAKCDPSITDVFLAERRTMRVLSNRSWKTIQTAVFRCVTCSKQTKVHKKDGSLLRLFGTFEHPALASGRCQELKARPVEEFKFASLSQE